MTYAPTAIDLSRVPAPDAIEPLDFETLNTAFLNRLRTAWDAARAKNPELPSFDTLSLESEPAVIIGEAASYLRLLDRARVNDAVKAVLAPLAKGSNLDNVVARQNIVRLVVTPANPTLGTAAVMETDVQLLRRYLLSFDQPSAGSAGRYLAEVFRAFPIAGDAAVLGHAVHGRRGFTDVVVSGPAGRDPTLTELAAVRAAMLAPHVVPEAVGVSVIPATRRPYAVSLVVEVPSGPDAALIATEAAARVKAATDERTLIGAEVPLDRITGAAYGPNIVRVRRLLPEAAIEADPYTVPVCTSITVIPEVLA